MEALGSGFSKSSKALSKSVWFRTESRANSPMCRDIEHILICTCLHMVCEKYREEVSCHVRRCMDAGDVQDHAHNAEIYKSDQL